MTNGRTNRKDENLYLGILLVALGALFLFDRMDVFDLHDAWQFWPFIIVAVGLSKIFTASKAEQAGTGLWLIFIGLWLYVSIEEIWDLGFRETWPAIVIAWGIGLVWKSFGRPWPFLRKDDAL